MLFKLKIASILKIYVLIFMIVLAHILKGFIETLGKCSSEITFREVDSTVNVKKLQKI
jgi:hypothetical protein